MRDDTNNGCKGDCFHASAAKNPAPFDLKKIKLAPFDLKKINVAAFDLKKIHLAPFDLKKINLAVNLPCAMLDPSMQGQVNCGRVFV